MCKLCEQNPVYEFTNKRKLCKNCFIKYFHKKVMYTNKKFNFLKKGDSVEYKPEKDFRGVVLENILKMLETKIGVRLIKTPDLKTAKKIAIPSTIDSEADYIINILIKKDEKHLSDVAPSLKNKKKVIIKPLYLFLDEEVLLYAKLLNLKFKKTKEQKNKISEFLDELEKKHPEVKRAVVNSYLELYC